MMIFKQSLRVFKEAGSSWLEDKAGRLGAALAYYSVFSLGPLIIIVLAVAGWFFGRSAAEGELYRHLTGVFGDNGAKAIQAMVAGARDPKAGSLAAIISLGTLLIGATGVIVQLKDALNTVWEVRPKPGEAAKSFLKTYVVSLASLLGLGFILVASLTLTTVLTFLGQYVAGVVPLSEWILKGADFLVSFAIITALFALMFKFLPDVEVQWQNVWIGAAGTAFFFSIGKIALGVYLGRQQFDSTYGAASSFIVILVWVYYLSQIVLFGAEFTKAYTHVFGPRERPAPEAESVTAKVRAEEGLAPEGRTKPRAV